MRRRGVSPPNMSNRSGVVLKPVASIHVKTRRKEWGAVKTTPFVSKHVENWWGGVKTTLSRGRAMALWPWG